MDGAGVEQAARAFMRNDPYFPRPAVQGTSDHNLWMEFRSHYLQISRDRAGASDKTGVVSLPERFITRAEEMHEQAMAKRSLASNPEP